MIPRHPQSIPPIPAILKPNVSALVTPQFPDSSVSPSESPFSSRLPVTERSRLGPRAKVQVAGECKILRRCKIQIFRKPEGPARFRTRLHHLPPFSGSPVSMFDRSQSLPFPPRYPRLFQHRFDVVFDVPRILIKPPFATTGSYHVPRRHGKFRTSSSPPRTIMRCPQTRCRPNIPVIVVKVHCASCIQVQ